jgi:hypothetical protein
MEMAADHGQAEFCFSVHSRSCPRPCSDEPYTRWLPRTRTTDDVGLVSRVQSDGRSPSFYSSMCSQ